MSFRSAGVFGGFYLILVNKTPRTLAACKEKISSYNLGSCVYNVGSTCSSALY